MATLCAGFIRHNLKHVTLNASIVIQGASVGFFGNDFNVLCDTDSMGDRP